MAHYKTPVSLLALCSVLLGGISLNAQTTVNLVTEDWSGYALDASPIGNGYVWGATTNPNNVAKIIRDEAESSRKVLSLLSWGGTANAPRVQKNVALDLSESLSTSVSGEIRYQSPGTVRNSGYPTFGIITNLGQIWYGFSGINTVFINMPPSTAGGTAPAQLKMTFASNIDVADWYRFTLNLDHVTGELGLSVDLLDGIDGNVVSNAWTVSNLSAGYDPMFVTSISSYRFEVSRPGSTTTSQITSDFSGITIDTVVVPEPSTVATLMGLGVLGLVLALRRRKAR